ncbi:hypothetical protein [Methanogenium sp. MK-MG]|uniref:hypothetical protein n=1 Tax=Methanogenium sp. MK-MG TaxID=2599926 RepID=UPI0013EA80DA|nr:hypothetical protein [Methanogenium sp. MK-MG]
MDPHPVRAATREDPFVEHNIAEKFRRYYTVSQKRYTVEGHHNLPIAIETDARE